jgi:predicted glycosyltransferase
MVEGNINLGSPSKTEKVTITLGKSSNMMGIPEGLEQIHIPDIRLEDKGNYYNAELELKYVPEVLKVLLSSIMRSNPDILPDLFHFAIAREIPGTKEGRCKCCGKPY